MRGQPQEEFVRQRRKAYTKTLGGQSKTGRVVLVGVGVGGVQVK